MPRNGSGTYSLPQPAFVAGTVISSAAVNSDFADIAVALTGSLPRDGQAGMTGQLKISDGSNSSPGLAFTNEVNTGFTHPATDEIGVVIGGAQVLTFTASGINGLLPIGMMADFTTAVAPALWILCYGQAISRTTYSALFAVIGTTYGSGDGTTTFNLPDCRGVVNIGKSDMGGTPTTVLTTTGYGNSPTVMGNPGGSQTSTLIGNNLPPITPAGTVSSFASGTTAAVPVQGGYPGTTLGGVAAIGTNTTSLTTIPATVTAPTISSTFSGSASGGSSTPFANVPPGIIFTRIIYAGA